MHIFFNIKYKYLACMIQRHSNCTDGLLGMSKHKHMGTKHDYKKDEKVRFQIIFGNPQDAVAHIFRHGNRLYCRWEEWKEEEQERSAIYCNIFKHNKKFINRSTVRCPAWPAASVYRAV